MCNALFLMSLSLNAGIWLPNHDIYTITQTVNNVWNKHFLTILSLYLLNFQIKFGPMKGFGTAIKKFHRSVNRDLISLTCAGWCGQCGPISGPIRFQHSMEFSKFETALFEEIRTLYMLMSKQHSSFSCWRKSCYLQQVKSSSRK